MSSSRALTRRALQLSNSRPTLSQPRIPNTSRQPTRAASFSTNHTATPTDFHALLATPTWSVRSLLPSIPPPSTITPQTLHHLLRLSSLPPPATPAAEAALLATLHTQLHFVRAIQAVDTTNIVPLTAIHDETSSSSGTITLDELLKGPLARESKVGFRGRPRRSRGGAAAEREMCAQEVDVEVKTRGRREGAYYVVESGKAKGGE